MQKTEKVLVIKRNLIFKKGFWEGIKKENLNYYSDLIKNKSQFQLREKVETDPTFKQIIPYIIFSFQDRYFIFQHLRKATEQRLKGDWLLGISGHINLVDVNPNQNIIEVAAQREWGEEIDYRGRIITKKVVGLLNSEKRQVEAVHLAVIYHYKGNSPKISIKEKGVLRGKLVKLENLAKFVENTGGYAPIVYRDYITKLK